MNKTIAILIFTFFLGCNAFAQAPQSVLPPYTTPPVVTITQQQFDSLVSAAACGNQMELIAKQEAERMFDIYTTHTSLLFGLIGVLVTILVGLVGAVFPYMTNKAYKREMDANIAAHDNSIQDIRDQMEQSEGKARESSKEAKAWALFSWARQIQLGTHGKRELDKAIDIYSQAITEFPQISEAYNNRGNAFFNKGEYDKAFQDYDEAIKLNPKYAEAYYNRGLAYMLRGKEGDYVLAKADFEKGLTLNPDEELRQKLQENLRNLEDLMKEKANKASAQ